MFEAVASALVPHVATQHELAMSEGPAGLIGEISDGYRRRFGQESVLRVVSEACVSFD